MAYRIPTFNMFCDIYTGIGGAYPPLGLVGGVPRNPGVRCALAHGRLSSKVAPSGTGFGELPITVMQLMVPAGTDIRGFENDALNGLDQVEVPVGSGRWYCVTSVDDVGKGYPNEYRLAYVQAIIQTWTPPYP
jgi:hypothetical protein